MPYPATGDHRSKRPRFIGKSACHKGTEVLLKQETHLHCVGFSKPGKRVFAIENRTTAATRLVTRYVSDILGQRGRGDDHGGLERDHTPGVFSDRKSIREIAKELHRGGYGKPDQ